MIDLCNAETFNGNDVCTWVKENCVEQRWKLIYVNGNEFMIKTNLCDRVLTCP